LRADDQVLFTKLSRPRPVGTARHELRFVDRSVRSLVDFRRRTVYPSLTYRDVGAALAWLEKAFGFAGRVLDDVGATVRYGGGIALIQSERPKDLHGSHTGQGWVYVVIDDADAYYERAKAAAANLQGEFHDYGDGHRGYSARDLEGNLWSFGTGPVT